jgi:hypothetical protein
MANCKHLQILLTQTQITKDPIIDATQNLPNDNSMINPHQQLQPNKPQKPTQTTSTTQKITLQKQTAHKNPQQQPNKKQQTKSTIVQKKEYG